ncbi:peptidylprolyl isomerase [Actinokineospora sp. 24-640]
MTVRRTAIAAALLAGAAALTACGSSTAGSPVAASPAPSQAVPSEAGASQAPTSQAPTSGASATAEGSPSGCDFQETPGDPPAGRDVGLPTGDDPPASVTLVTNHGEITMRLDTGIAPCTTLSIGHLAKSGFYDSSPCHRLTKADSLSVLQCGDPSGTGSGGPGYTVPDENPKNLPTVGQYAKYPRGTVAMANTGQPHTGGSQFFLVYADSALPPTYAVFATVDDAGLAVLDKIAKGGISGGAGAQDGAPAEMVLITQAKAEG